MFILLTLNIRQYSSSFSRKSNHHVIDLKFVDLATTFFIFFDSADIIKNDCTLFGDSILNTTPSPMISDGCLSPCCFLPKKPSLRWNASPRKARCLLAHHISPYCHYTSPFIVWKYNKIYHEHSCTILSPYLMHHIITKYIIPYITILSPWVLPPLCCTP